jgi:hypothetical protein
VNTATTGAVTAAAATPTPAHIATAPAATTPSIPFAPPAAAQPASTTPEVTTPKPVHVMPPAPTAAVIWTNGLRRLVGLSQVFKVSDAQFRLVGVTPETVRLAIVGGSFAGGKHTITARKGHRVELTNTATGVLYRLLFTAGSTNAPTTPTSGVTQP